MTSGAAVVTNRLTQLKCGRHESLRTATSRKTCTPAPAISARLWPKSFAADRRWGFRVHRGGELGHLVHASEGCGRGLNGPHTDCQSPLGEQSLEDDRIAAGRPRVQGAERSGRTADPANFRSPQNRWRRFIEQSDQSRESSPKTRDSWSPILLSISRDGPFSRPRAAETGRDHWAGSPSDVCAFSYIGRVGSNSSIEAVALALWTSTNQGSHGIVRGSLIRSMRVAASPPRTPRCEHPFIHTPQSA